LSSESASVMSRLSDILRKYLRRLVPSAVKMSFYYDVGQSFEGREESLTRRLLDLASRAYTFFSFGESKLYKYYKAFVKDLIDLTSAIEDALSFTSLYMNLLVVFAMLLMVFLAWKP
jgi:hypothetical protein